MSTERSIGWDRRVVSLAIAAVSVVLWFAVIRQASSMSGMHRPRPWIFVSSWSVMMAAMMLPSLSPVATLWMRAIAATDAGLRRAYRLLATLVGYALVWTAFGLVVLAAQDLAREAIGVNATAARVAAAGVFALAGSYQVAPAKTACLRRCRSPIGHVLGYGGIRGPLRDLRVGLHHGAWCLGCCWALMAVLIVVGVMSVPAMAVLAIVVYLEKATRHGERISRWVGVVLLALALVALVVPALSAGLLDATMAMGPVSARM